MTPAATARVPIWLVAVLAVAALIVVGAFAPWVLLAVWIGRYAGAIERPLRIRLGGRRGLSSALTVVLCALLLAPIGIILASVVDDAIRLVHDLIDSDRAQGVFEKLAGGDSAPAGGAKAGVLDVLMGQGDRAWAIAQQLAGAAGHFLIGLLLLVSGIYGVLVEGDAWYAWGERHAPMSPATYRRFADAFVETGRGLLFGIVGAGLLQSLVATAAYLVIGVPQALPLGLLTLMFSVIPAVGTAIVWVPVAIGLGLTGQTGAAIALGITGAVLIGGIDNLARPWLARRGELQLPSYVVMLSMFGGIQVLGGWGLVIGPLAVRLAKEAIELRREPEPGASR